MNLNTAAQAPPIPFLEEASQFFGGIATVALVLALSLAVLAVIAWKVGSYYTSKVVLAAAGSAAVMILGWLLESFLDTPL